MTNPEISVIVTNYNHSQYIESAVKSILNQTVQNYEIIIVDDCSTDNSKDIIETIKKLDSRIQSPIYLPINKGKWYALNTAISTAKGKLITLQDADDESHSHRLQNQLFVLKAKKSYHNLCGFKHCYTQLDFDQGKAYTPTLDAHVMDHSEVLEKVHKGYKTDGINHYFVGHDYEVHGASSLFYKQFWEHGLRFNPNGLGLMPKIKGEDGDHNFRLTTLLQKTSVLKEPLYLYRRNSSTNPSWTLGN